MNHARRLFGAIAGSLVLIGIVASPAEAFAQDAGASPPAPGGSKRSTEALDLDQYGAKGVITGSEHMPDFTVLIDRENLSRAFELDLEERFLTKIIEAVGREPF